MKPKTHPPSPPLKGGGIVSEMGESKVFQALKDFRQFVKERHGNNYSDHILHKRWITVASSFINAQLQGNQSYFLQVLDWYKENVNGKYIPECMSIPGFCERFRQIEKARARASDSIDASPSPQVTVVISKNKPTEDTW